MGSEMCIRDRFKRVAYQRLEDASQNWIQQGQYTHEEAKKRIANLVQVFARRAVQYGYPKKMEPKKVYEARTLAEKNLAIALRRRMAARARRRASAANRSTVKRPFQRAVRRNREGFLGRLLGLPRMINEGKDREVTDPSLPVVDAMMQARPALV